MSAAVLTQVAPAASQRILEDAVQGELEKVFEIAWDGYIQYRKSPRSQAAGSEFSDPSFKLPVEWLPVSG